MCSCSDANKSAKNLPDASCDATAPPCNPPPPIGTITLLKLKFETTYNVCSDTVENFSDYKNFYILEADGKTEYHWFVKIAQAALGDDKIVNDFIDSLEAANAAGNAKDFSNALHPLSLIGTTKTLKVIAKHLRTPLIIDVRGAYRKSVRLDVLEALRYNFPDQSVLYPNNINEESDYAAAEKFCINKFAVVYTTPPPPFMTYFGYPSPMPK